jgi:hypothetical protein
MERLFFIKRLVPVYGWMLSGVLSIHGGKSVYIRTVGCLNWTSTKVRTISRRRVVAFQLTDWPLTHSPVRCETRPPHLAFFLSVGNDRKQEECDGKVSGAFHANEDLGVV